MLVFIIWLAVIGLVVGAVARVLMPGPDAIGIPMTIVVGLVGAFVGGLIGRALFHDSGGFILAVIGAMLVLFVVRRVRV